ncbi:MAG: hypothetical protein ACYTF6_08725, partial [Planctomycetota bacterium]
MRENFLTAAIFDILWVRYDMAGEPMKSERENLRRLLELAREEDLGAGDVTAAVVPKAAKLRARFVAGQELVFCGGVFLADVAAAYDKAIGTAVKAPEGERAAEGGVLAEWSGPARAILAAERVALN